MFATKKNSQIEPYEDVERRIDWDSASGLCSFINHFNSTISSPPDVPPRTFVSLSLFHSLSCLQRVFLPLMDLATSTEFKNSPLRTEVYV